MTLELSSDLRYHELVALTHAETTIQKILNYFEFYINYSTIIVNEQF